ncbi:ATP-binding protein [Methylocystis sp. MJC1]|jgi:signal transduction histidine kinase|uniref:sensor histidine kinase n=1 Tax=Methylocystis sp. MJC1 TaxID=2654282 RepID=UPI001FEF8900|nr:ATP-binding protein [Methylocystis sp. MJC1]KAF2989975.1 Swarming motility regulation sensor protein RssA [Methylocystis sp. MJC1]UZX13802.1 ATP-binding protein [Methylocystis sp. MJC1]
MLKVSWPSFRRTLIYATVFIVSSSVLFLFVYWKAAADEIERIEALLELQGSALSVYQSDQARLQPGDRAFNETFRLSASGLFESNGAYLRGDLRDIPPDLPIDGRSHLIESIGQEGGGAGRIQVIMVANRLTNGRMLVIARNATQVVNLEETVKKALVLGVLPLSLLSIVTGAIFSQYMNRRLKTAQQCLNDIKGGRLHRRLPVSAAKDELDQLAKAVNDMLSELEYAVYELKNVGNNIAHDLRTPLSRVRAHLEHAQRCEEIPPDAQELIERAITGLDQTLAITTAMLRLVQLEAGRNSNQFCEIDLQEILQEVAELYEPLAENKNIRITLSASRTASVIGDRDLLIEAIANVIDNSVKFTPNGGEIQLNLVASAQGPVIQIHDSGPGIPREHRNDVFKRFYRCSQSRDVPGTGLGLTLVAAILKLHRFHVEICDGAPGCALEIRCFS